MGGLYALIKALVLSIAVHATAVALVMALTSSWFEHAQGLPVNARIDVDVLRVGEESGRGEKKQAESPRKQPAESIRQAPVSTTQSGSVAAQSQVDSAATGADNITIDGDGRPLSLTTQEFIHWIRSNNSAPSYPRLARMRGEQGTVMVKVSLVARGMPAEKIELQSSSGSELLDRVALEAVRSWRFPAFRGRERLEIVFPFRFSLEDG